MSDLRAVIREVLQEELARLRGGIDSTPRVTEEAVVINSNADLQAFVQRLMSLAADGRMRAEIEAGRHVFRLASAPSAPIQAHQPAAPAPAAAPPPVRFERGLVTEREVGRLPDTQRSIQVGKSVRFTPLGARRTASARNQD